MKLRLSRKWVIILLLTVAVATAVTNHLFAWVTVKGHSMWPQLHDGETLILRRGVHKLRNGDVAVFDVDGRWLVKTVGFVGPGWFSIREGDLFSGLLKDGLSRMRLVGESIMDRSQLLMDTIDDGSFEVLAGRVAVSDDRQHLLLDANREDASVLFPTKGLHLRRVTATGRSLLFSEPACDIFVTFELPKPVQGVGLSVSQVFDGKSGDAFHLLADGWEWRLRSTSRDATRSVSISSPVTLGFVDGALWLISKGAPAQELSPRSTLRASFLSQLKIEASGGTPTLQHLAIFGDAHWGEALPSAVFVPSGAVFLLGDNPGASEDSRSFGPIPVSQMVGRPL